MLSIWKFVDICVTTENKWHLITFLRFIFYFNYFSKVSFFRAFPPITQNGTDPLLHFYKVYLPENPNGCSWDRFGILLLIFDLKLPFFMLKNINIYVLLPIHPERKCSCVVQGRFDRKGWRAFCQWAALHIISGSPALTDGNTTKRNSYKLVKFNGSCCWTFRTHTHTPMLTIRSMHWLIWGNLSISFHFPLLPFPPVESEKDMTKIVLNTSKLRQCQCDVTCWRRPHPRSPSHLTTCPLTAVAPHACTLLLLYNHQHQLASTHEQTFATKQINKHFKGLLQQQEYY